jgi:hypothetical protein
MEVIDKKFVSLNNMMTKLRKKNARRRAYYSFFHTAYKIQLANKISNMISMSVNAAESAR